MASEVFTHSYFIYKTSTPGVFMTSTNAGTTKNFTITDTPDPGTNDNTTQLGDIQGDMFTELATGGKTTGTRSYFGQSASGSGVVGTATGGKGLFYAFYTNNSYGTSAPVTIVQTPFTLCFGPGTRILTANGPVAVEDLRVGDIAVTATGARRPVVWIGQRHLEGQAGPLAFEQQPVRVRAGAFGRDADGALVPARDLRLSPGHPVLVGADADGQGGVLVPVMCLVNGASIAREVVDRITYWHVELDAHDILLAEGLPAESFHDMGSRAFFGQGSDDPLHDPDMVPAGLSGRCRPVAVDGPLVEAERRRLDHAFAAALTQACAWSEAEPAWLAA